MCQKDGQRGRNLIVDVGDIGQLEKSYVGVLFDPMKLNVVGETFMLQGMEFIRARYMGDEKVLLTQIEEGKSLGELVAEKTEWLGDLFESIQNGGL